MFCEVNFNAPKDNAAARVREVEEKEAPALEELVGDCGLQHSWTGDGAAKRLQAPFRVYGRSWQDSIMRERQNLSERVYNNDHEKGPRIFLW